LSARNASNGAFLFLFIAVLVDSIGFGIILPVLPQLIMQLTGVGIDRAAAPLDRYSFPSGHTLHAVSFTWQAGAHFPELLWVLVPLAALIGASRVVLGLHYPSDVLAGAAIGAALAELGLSIA